jgi:hypothetical protein
VLCVCACFGLPVLFVCHYYSIKIGFFSLLDQESYLLVVALLFVCLFVCLVFCVALPVVLCVFCFSVLSFVSVICLPL